MGRSKVYNNFIKVNKVDNEKKPIENEEVKATQQPEISKKVSETKVEFVLTQANEDKGIVVDFS